MNNLPAPPRRLDPEPRHVGRGTPVTWVMTPRMAERRARMRDVGVRLFAAAGVAHVTILDVAREAHVPPSAASHGYRRKSELVFDILHAYVDALHEYVGSADEAHTQADPMDRLVAVAEALLCGMLEHHDAHRIMLRHLAELPEAEREVLRYLQRTLIHRLGDPLESVLPALRSRRTLRAPLMQSLVAMASHAPNWLNDAGPLATSDYARLMVRGIVAAAS